MKTIPLDKALKTLNLNYEGKKTAKLVPLGLA